MLNTVKSVLADILSVSPSSEQRRRANMLEIYSNFFCTYISVCLYVWVFGVVFFFQIKFFLVFSHYMTNVPWTAGIPLKPPCICYVLSKNQVTRKILKERETAVKCNSIYFQRIMFRRQLLNPVTELTNRPDTRCNIACNGVDTWCNCCVKCCRSRTCFYSCNIARNVASCVRSLNQENF